MFSHRLLGLSVFHFSIILAVSVHPSSAFAQKPELTEEIVVTANRLNTPGADVASSVTVITQEEIQRKQRTHLADLLREVPGLSVFSSGGPGKNTSVFIRGTNSDHTLVLIDGIEMNDPLGTARQYDFGNFSTQDIERIEVVRGSQSVLYGSDAIGGVIQIITKKGAGTLHGNVEAEYGAYHSYRLQGNVRGGDSKTNYSLGAGHQGTEGFPAADKNLGNQINTGQNLTTVTGDLGLELIPRTSLNLNARFSDSRFGLPATGGPPGYDAYGYRTGDDPNFTGTDRQGYGKIQLDSLLTESWDSKLAFSYSLNHRTSDHLPSSVNPTESHSTYDSKRLRGLFQNNLYTSDSNTVTLGIDSSIESGTSTVNEPITSPDSGIKDKSMLVTGVFAQDQWLSKTLFGTAGMRYDAYANVASQLTYRVAPGYKIPITKTVIRGSVGSGFKVPSLFQRFSSYGDPNLQPERSLSYDVGVDQELGDPSTLFGITYFRTNFDQLIDYNFTTNRYANKGRANSQGIEAGLRSKVFRDLAWNLTYTYTFARDDQTGLVLLRRPRHQLTAEVNYQISDRSQFGLLGRYLGNREDIDAVSAVRVEMPAFTVLYLTASYRVSDHLWAFGRIDNLLDQAYQEVNGFGTPGRSYFAGLIQDL